MLQAVNEALNSKLNCIVRTIDILNKACSLKRTVLSSIIGVNFNYMKSLPSATLLFDYILINLVI